MILHLAPGEPSYLPDVLLGPKRDEAHRDLAPLLHHFASRTGAWEAVALLAEHEGWCPLTVLAAGLCLTPAELLQQLWGLVKDGILQEELYATGPHYRLRANHRLRRLALLLAVGATEAPP